MRRFIVLTSMLMALTALAIDMPTAEITAGLRRCRQGRE
jgi:hypothetical protein